MPWSELMKDGAMLLDQIQKEQQIILTVNKILFQKDNALCDKELKYITQFKAGDIENVVVQCPIYQPAVKLLLSNVKFYRFDRISAHLGTSDTANIFSLKNVVLTPKIRIKYFVMNVDDYKGLQVSFLIKNASNIDNIWLKCFYLKPESLVGLKVEDIPQRLNISLERKYAFKSNEKTVTNFGEVPSSRSRRNLGNEVFFKTLGSLDTPVFDRVEIKDHFLECSMPIKGRRVGIYHNPYKYLYKDVYYKRTIAASCRNSLTGSPKIKMFRRCLVVSDQGLYKTFSFSQTPPPIQIARGSKNLRRLRQ